MYHDEIYNVLGSLKTSVVTVVSNQYLFEHVLVYLQVSKILTPNDCLLMAQKMVDERLMKSAELWLRVTEEKLGLVNDGNKYDEDYKNMELMKEEVDVYNHVKETIELHDDLCKKLETTGHEENFKKGSISCKFVQDRGNPLSRRKLEELSVEPKVVVLHDFLSQDEVDEVVRKSQYYTYSRIHSSAIFMDIPDEIKHHFTNNLRTCSSFNIDSTSGPLVKEDKMIRKR